MDSVAPALQRACEWLEAIVGTLGTILMVALTFGLIFLCIGLTILVLWRSFSFGFRFTVLKAWVKVRDFLTMYFNRLRRYGLTRVASRIAVACGFVVWGGVALAFAFEEQLWAALAITLSALLCLFAWGWWKRGPRAQFFTFARGFLEPTIAFAVPAFIGKSGDFIFKMIWTTIKHVI
jgi:hypothetical protein